MAEILKDLPLAEKIKAALTEETSDLGQYLALSKYYEKGEWDKVCQISSMLQISECEIPSMYMSACEWANGLIG